MCLEKKKKQEYTKEYQPVWPRSWQPASQSSSFPFEAGVCWDVPEACQLSVNAKKKTQACVYMCGRVSNFVFVFLLCAQQVQIEFTST